MTNSAPCNFNHNSWHETMLKNDAFWPSTPSSVPLVSKDEAYTMNLINNWEISLNWDTTNWLSEIEVTDNSQEAVNIVQAQIAADLEYVPLRNIQSWGSCSSVQGWGYLTRSAMRLIDSNQRPETVAMRKEMKRIENNINTNSWRNQTSPRVMAIKYARNVALILEDYDMASSFWLSEYKLPKPRWKMSLAMENWQLPERKLHYRKILNFEIDKWVKGLESILVKINRISDWWFISHKMKVAFNESLDAEIEALIENWIGYSQLSNIAKSKREHNNNEVRSCFYNAYMLIKRSRNMKKVNNKNSKRDFIRELNDLRDKLELMWKFW